MGKAEGKNGHVLIYYAGLQFFYSKIYISHVSVGLRITIDHDDRSDNELQVICAAQTKAVCTCYKMISIIVKLPIKLFLLPNEALLLQQVGPRSEKEILWW